jgi:AcrR family transcriptional regulator
MQRRLWHDDRHRQLLGVAEKLLSERGWDGLRIPDLAEAAGVTRPIVYKHFRTRRDLILELVRAYADEMQAQLLDAVKQHPEHPELCLRVALNGLCDLIEARGPGVWNLLSSGGPDPELNQVIEALRTELMHPWIPRIRKLTKLSTRQARLLCHLTFAAVRTVLERWGLGEISRREGEKLLLRSLTALLGAFADGV